jgi:hypothetical protein
MTTKAPAAVQEFPPESLEKKAYTSVSSIPTVEPNDRNRLGFHVWRWLTSKEGTLEQAIAESGSRLQIDRAEAARIIRESLSQLGISG